MYIYNFLSKIKTNNYIINVTVLCGEYYNSIALDCCQNNKLLIYWKCSKRLPDSVPMVLNGALQALHSFVKSNSGIRGSAMQIQ
jgi:hypothetical protein